MTGNETALVCAVVCLCAYALEGNVYNPVFLMSGLWSIIMCLANMKLYGMFGASSLTYILIALGIVCFAVGAAINKQKYYVLGEKGRQRLQKYARSEGNNEINYRLLHLLCVLSVVVMIYPAVQSMKQLILYGITMNDIRSDNSLTYSNALLKMISNYIARPFSFAIIPIFAAEVIAGKKRDRVVTLCTILIVIERVLMEGGRMIILTVVINLLLAVQMNRRVEKRKEIEYERKPRKKWLLIVLVIVVAFTGIYWVSLSRGIQSDEFLFSLYAYLCGCVPNLSIRLDNVLSHGEHTYGLASLNGYFAFIFSVFDHLGFGTPQFYRHAQSLMNVESGVQIRAYGSAHFNAFVGPYFYMYLDGGILGVMFGMAIYGAVSNHFYKMFRNYHRKRDFIMYLLIAQGLINSMVRIQFVNTYYAMAFVYLFILTI